MHFRTYAIIGAERCKMLSNKTTGAFSMLTRLSLQALLGLLTLFAVGLTVLGIILLVEKEQTRFWFNTLQYNELIEPAVDMNVLILNSRNQYFSAKPTPRFGSDVSLCTYSVTPGSLSVLPASEAAPASADTLPALPPRPVIQTKFFARDATNGKFVLSEVRPPASQVLRLQLSAGNNRGFVVLFDMAAGKRYWLVDSLEWVSSLPASRPFVFLTSEFLA
jgi:hypothetical protein